MMSDALPTAEQLIPTGGTAGNIPAYPGSEVQSIAAYRDVRKLNIYDFMKFTFEGSEGYKDCSFLIPNDREMFYETRRRSSYYVNAFKPLLNAMVNPVFAKGVKRETGNDWYKGFIENCDAAGTHLNVFMRQAITHARLYTVNFIVMDNFKANEVKAAETAEAAVKARLYPYIYEKQPQQVYKHTTDARGRIESITFCDRVESVKTDKGVEQRQYYRYFDRMNWQLYYITKSDGKEEKIVIVEEDSHGLGVVPVIPIIDFANSASLKELPQPELYDIAFLCFGLFNKESEVVQMEKYQTFSILCTSGVGGRPISLGVSTYLDSPPDAKFPPQYAAPPQEGIRVLIENCQRLKEEIRSQAQQNGIVGVKDAKSGIAKEWDFRAEEAVLKETSLACERVENTIAQLFGLYTNQTIQFSVEYPKEFSPQADIDKVNTGMLVLRETPPRSVEKAIWQEVVSVFWKGQKDRIEEINASLDADMDEVSAIETMKKEAEEGVIE